MTGRRNNPIPTADRQQIDVDERPDRKEHTRVPMHARDVTTVKGKKDHKYYRWCLDINNKILRYMDAGYEFVEDQALSIGQMSVNPKTRTGNVVSMTSGDRTLYLMAIDKELYEMDQKAKSIEVNEMEKTMYAKTRAAADYAREFDVDNTMRA